MAKELTYDNLVKEFGGFLVRDASPETMVPFLLRILKTNELSVILDVSKATASRLKNHSDSIKQKFIDALYEFYEDISNASLDIPETDTASYIPMYTASDVNAQLNEMKLSMEKMQNEMETLMKKTRGTMRSLRDEAPKNEKQLQTSLQGYAKRQKLRLLQASSTVPLEELTKEAEDKALAEATKFKPGTFVDALKTHRRTFKDAKYEIIDDQNTLFLPVPVSEHAHEEGNPASYESLEEWRVSTGLGDAKYDDFYNQLTIEEHDIMEFIHLFEFGRPGVTKSPLQYQSEEDFKMWKDNLMTNPAVFWSALAMYGRNNIDSLRQQIFDKVAQNEASNYDAQAGLVYKSGFNAPEKPLFENIEDFREWFAKQKAWMDKNFPNATPSERARGLRDWVNIPSSATLYPYEDLETRYNENKASSYALSGY